MRKLFRKIKQGIRSIYSYPEKIASKTEYDEYWKSKRSNNMNQMNSFQLKRAEIISEIIEDESTLLDIGTGDGNILKFISNFKKINATASDFSLKSIKHLEQENFNVLNLDINNLEAVSNLEIYDYITALEVLEHIQNSESILLELMKKSRKGVLISFPNTGYIFYRIRFLFGRFPVQWRLHPGEHLRFWTYKDLNWWLKKLNIKDYEVYTYEGLPFFKNLNPGLFAEAFVIHIKK